MSEFGRRDWVTAGLFVCVSKTEGAAQLRIGKRFSRIGEFITLFRGHRQHFPQAVGAERKIPLPVLSLLPLIKTVLCSIKQKKTFVTT